jgi:hypothetical protein
MSKMDDLRAMREARYAQTAASTSVPTPRAATKRPAPSPDVTPPAVVPDSPEERRCGHRAISGRTCTREQGHSEKSHRYS